MRAVTKSLTLFFGVSLCGISAYMLYLLWKKQEEDDLDSTYPVASKYRIIEVRVPKDLVRVLIGRNGTNIKLIQEHSNTRINFKDRDGSDDKICLIRGSAEACVLAENLIQEFIQNQPVLESIDVWVPIGCVGAVIGRNGQRINEIRTLSGAKLNVVDSEDDNFSTKRITLKGTVEQINVAKSLIEDIVEKSQQSQKVINDSLAKREPRLPQKSPEMVKRVESPKVERISPIPGQSDTQFEVYISAMVDPSRFWLQIVGPKATELDCLVEEMTEYYNKIDNRNQHVLYDIKKGDVVAAIFQYDNKWYRAEILNINDNKTAELYYVDYGDTDEVPCNELFELRTDFLRLHFQAIECFLAKVEPAGSKWTEDAIDTFEVLTHVAQWKKLSAKINGYMTRDRTRAKREGSPIPGVDLFDVNNDQDIDIAEELVRSGLAVYKKDADLRSNSRTTSTSNVSVDSST